MGNVPRSLGGLLTYLLLHAKQRIGFLIQENRIIAYTFILQQCFEFRPDGVMAFAVFFFAAWFELHLKSDFHNMAIDVLSDDQKQSDSSHHARLIPMIVQYPLYLGWSGDKSTKPC